MNIEYHKPKNKVLQDLIECYYFINENDSSGSSEYETFPNNNVFYTINRNTIVKEDKGNIYLNPSNKNNISGSLVLSYSKPMRIFYAQMFDEITISFKPLGIHHFNINSFQSNPKKTIIDFNLFDDVNNFANKIFELDENDKGIALENYLISKLVEVDVSLIKLIITDIENESKVDEISEKYSISRQYITRIFQKYLSKSPSEYRKIYRFRNSLSQKSESKNLTELSLEQYYDQSHFIKNFKSITSLSPNHFFKEVEIDDDVIWRYF